MDDKNRPMADEDKSGSNSSIEQCDPDKKICEENKKQETFPILMPQDNAQFFGVPPSPPMAISLDQIMQASTHFSDMALAHEIAVNKDFLLKKAPKQGLEKQVTEVVHEVFWDNLQQQLMESPPDYSQALILLREIKEALMNVIFPHQEAVRMYINEKLDLDLIEQQVENNTLDFQQYADFITSTMAKLCAPVRDGKIRELRTVKEIVPLYKGILETLDLMKLDLANFTIQTMRPHIQQHSAEYEKTKFKEFLESLADIKPPVDGLQLTKEWFQSVYTKIKSSTGDKKVNNSEMITKAFLEVLLWDEDCVFPETLQMDKERFLTLRKEFLTIVVTASVLLLTFSIVGESIQGIGSLKLLLKEQLSVLLKSASNTRNEENLKEYLRSVEIQVIKEVDECLLKHGFSALSESKKAALSSQINGIGSSEHNVRKIITTRVLEFLENILNASKTASTPVKIPLGLSAFNKELSNVAGALSRLVTHNHAVFGDYYIDIMEKITESD